MQCTLAAAVSTCSVSNSPRSCRAAASALRRSALACDSWPAICTLSSRLSANRAGKRDSRCEPHLTAHAACMSRTRSCIPDSMHTSRHPGRPPDSAYMSRLVSPASASCSSASDSSSEARRSRALRSLRVTSSGAASGKLQPPGAGRHLMAMEWGRARHIDLLAQPPSIPPLDSGVDLGSRLLSQQQAQHNSAPRSRHHQAVQPLLDSRGRQLPAGVPGNVQLPLLVHIMRRLHLDLQGLAAPLQLAQLHSSHGAGVSHGYHLAGGPWPLRPAECHCMPVRRPASFTCCRAVWCLAARSAWSFSCPTFASRRRVCSLSEAADACTSSITPQALPPHPLQEQRLRRTPSPHNARVCCLLMPPAPAASRAGFASPTDLRLCLLEPQPLQHLLCDLQLPVPVRHLLPRIPQLLAHGAAAQVQGVMLQRQRLHAGGGARRRWVPACASALQAWLP